jgi:outer membrane lipoprotein SlyB
MAKLRLSTTMALIAVLSVAACAPQRTNTTYSAADIGRTQQLSYGTIISMRPVTVQGQQTGVGTAGGAVAGAVAGSYIGGRDPRANFIGAIGGAILGGVVGTAVEKDASTGQAVEFIIQEDNAPQPISVVQTNEDNFHPGERIIISRGARTRLARISQ